MVKSYVSKVWTTWNAQAGGWQGGLRSSGHVLFFHIMLESGATRASAHALVIAETDKTNHAHARVHLSTQSHKGGGWGTFPGHAHATRARTLSLLHLVSADPSHTCCSGKSVSFGQRLPQNLENFLAGFRTRPVSILEGASLWPPFQLCPVFVYMCFCFG